MTDDAHVFRCAECGQPPVLHRLGDEKEHADTTYGLECHCGPPTGVYVKFGRLPDSWEALADD